MRAPFVCYCWSDLHRIIACAAPPLAATSWPTSEGSEQGLGCTLVTYVQCHRPMLRQCLLQMKPKLLTPHTGRHNLPNPLQALARAAGHLLSRQRRGAAPGCAVSLAHQLLLRSSSHGYSGFCLDGGRSSPPGSLAQQGSLGNASVLDCFPSSIRLPAAACLCPPPGALCLAPSASTPPTCGPARCALCCAVLRSALLCDV